MKILKWIGIIVLAIIVIGIGSAIFMNVQAGNRLAKTYEINPPVIPLPSDSASLARGQHLAEVICAGCHGGAYEGKPLIDEANLATVYSPNITSGEGGLTKNYTDIDWIRSVRHGVNPEGRSMFIMPAKDFIQLSEADLGSIIAYMKTVPPAHKEWPEQKYRLLGKLLMQAGAFGDVLHAEIIDHEASFPEHPAEEVSAEYGEYWVEIIGCGTCHGKDMGGMQGPEPGAPFSPNLTSGGNLANWSDTDFLQTLRSGKTPEGHELDEDFMPWTYYAKMTDDELKAMYLYFKSLPPVENE